MKKVIEILHALCLALAAWLRGRRRREANDVRRARRRSARFAETVPFEGALAYTRVMKRIAKTGCTLAEADAYVREKYGER